MSELTQHQYRFLGMAARLILKAEELALIYGWDGVRGGELWRDPRWAKQLAEMGVGILLSLHCDRSALDLVIDVGGKPATDSEVYRPLGEYWESIGGYWGGRRTDASGKPKPDGGHFSLPFGGRA
jgi:hypothetical protein